MDRAQVLVKTDQIEDPIIEKGSPQTLLEANSLVNLSALYNQLHLEDQIGTDTMTRKDKRKRDKIGGVTRERKRTAGHQAEASRTSILAPAKVEKVSREPQGARPVSAQSIGPNPLQPYKSPLAWLRQPQATIQAFISSLNGQSDSGGSVMKRSNVEQRQSRARGADHSRMKAKSPLLSDVGVMGSVSTGELQGPSAHFNTVASKNGPRRSLDDIDDPSASSNGLAPPRTISRKNGKGKKGPKGGRSSSAANPSPSLTPILASASPPPSKLRARGSKVKSVPRLPSERQPPDPIADYLTQSGKASERLTCGQRLLVILDLNGTLLYRPKRSSPTVFRTRPHVSKFLRYLLRDHFVLVWSSARPQNVSSMCKTLFTNTQREALLGEWGRDTFGLSTAEYNQRTQVYKDLTQVWEDTSVQEKHPLAGLGVKWHQGNTVLIDDSTEKARAQPWNLIRVDEWFGKAEESAVLESVVGYLEQCRWRSDVSAWVREEGFGDGLRWANGWPDWLADSEDEASSTVEETGEEAEWSGRLRWRSKHPSP